MTKQATQIPLRRHLDRSARRKPLRLGISRHLARRGDGDRYVTKVRVGRKSAVLVPLNLALAAQTDPA